MRSNISDSSGPPIEPASDDPTLPCSSKLAFDTQREANAVTHVIYYKYGTTVHSYRCSYCKLWHMSSGAQQGSASRHQ